MLKNTEKIIKNAIAFPQPKFDLTGPIDQIYNSRMKSVLKLKDEGGVTRVSLQNVDKLIKYFGRPASAIFYMKDTSRTNFETRWRDPETNEMFYWNFKGFSAGYEGEGLRGLLLFLNRVGIKKSRKDILGILPQKKYIFTGPRNI